MRRHRGRRRARTQGRSRPLAPLPSDVLVRLSQIEDASVSCEYVVDVNGVTLHVFNELQGEPSILEVTSGGLLPPHGSQAFTSFSERDGHAMKEGERIEP